MFIGLMNFVDRLRLKHYKKKLGKAKDALAQAEDDRAVLVRAEAAFAQSKAAHVDDVVRYKGGWVSQPQAEKKLEELKSPTGRLSQADFEKYGTACAVIKRRIARREAKMPQRASASLIV